MALALRMLRLNTRATARRMLSTEPSENIFADEEAGLTEEAINEKRDISRMTLRMHMRKVKQEYITTVDSDYSLKSLRKDYVCFGVQTGLNPGICWPNKEEIADLQFIEKRYYPTFDELKSKYAEKREAQQKAFTDREAELEANLEKLAVWRKEMLAREEKAEQAAAEKKAKMDELIREVREHIGYNVDPSDPKFQEVMEMKEAERKKIEKEAKKLLKKQRMMQRLLSVPKVVAPLPSSAPATGEQQPEPPKPSSGSEDAK